MTTTAKRRSTAPRKAATARANGSANGHPPPSPQPAEVRPPTLVEPTPETPPPSPDEVFKPKPIEHPYGDKAVYVFHPKAVKHPGDSMDPIVLPHISTLNADVEFFWEIDDLDPMHQSFQYMKKALVPRDIQRRVVRLPDDEMGRLFRAWFMGIVTPQGVGPPGES